MKKLFLVLVLAFLSLSCNNECTQTAYSEIVSGSTAKSASTSKGAGDDKILVCHKGSTLEINAGSLQDHLSHGDTEGECSVLSDDGLNFSDGQNVEIDCKYTLPFIHVDDNNVTWLFSEAR